MNKKGLPRASTLLTELFEVVLLSFVAYALYWYATNYSAVTAVFTEKLPTAFGNGQDKIGAAIDAKGINLGSLFISFLWVIYTIIVGLIVLFLWLVVGNLHKYYVVPFVLAALLLWIDPSRKMILRTLRDTRSLITFMLSLAIHIIIAKFLPFLFHKAKLLKDLLIDLFAMFLQRLGAFVLKQIRGRR